MAKVVKRREVNTRVERLTVSIVVGPEALSDDVVKLPLTDGAHMRSLLCKTSLFFMICPCISKLLF